MSVGLFQAMMGGPAFGGSGGFGATPGIRPAGRNTLQEILMRQQEAQQQMALAQQLSQIGGSQSKSWGDVIGTLLGGYQASKLRGKANDNIAQAIEQGLAYEQQQAAAAQQAKLAEEQRRAESEFNNWRRKQEWARDNAPQQGPGSELELFLDDPEAHARYLAATREPATPKDTRTTGQKDYEYLMGLPEEQRDTAARAMGMDLGGPSAEPPGNLPTGMMWNPEAGKAEQIPGVEPKISEGERKKANAQQEIRDALLRYQELLQEHGTEWGGEKAAALETAYQAVLLKAKNAEELGVLSGPDVGIIEGVIGTNPTNARAQFNLWGGKNRLAKVEEYLRQFQGGAFQPVDLGGGFTLEGVE